MLSALNSAFLLITVHCTALGAAMTHVRKAVGKVIRQLRKQQGLSQETLSYKSGFDRTYISQLERGKYSPKLENILDMCQTLDIKFTDFAAMLENELELAKNEDSST